MELCNKLVFYASANGYGHATRAIALAKYMLTFGMADEVTICSGERQFRFLQTECAGTPIKLRCIADEPALPLKPNYYPDTGRLDEELQRWHISWDKWIDIERAFTADYEPSMLISDCSPQPLLLGKSLGIPTVLIGNATWLDICEPLVDNDKVVRALKTAYEAADHRILLRGAAKGGKQVGFFSRPVNSRKIFAIRERYGNGKTVMVSMGRTFHFRISGDITSLADQIVTTPGTEIRAKNELKITPDRTGSQNYVAASDAVITKAGWSTVAEALNNNRPLVVLYRQNVSSELALSRYLFRKRLAAVVPFEHASVSTLHSAVNRATELSRCENSENTSNDLSSAARSISTFLRSQVPLQTA
ncbi:MAG: glycosyltransferase [Planctomycetota bacterium]|nr:glycosyltransferase [Planctomycetota bacterium]